MEINYEWGDLTIEKRIDRLQERRDEDKPDEREVVIHFNDGATLTLKYEN